MRLSDWRTRAPHKDALDAQGVGRHRSGPGVARRRARPVGLDRLGRGPGRPVRDARPDRRGPPAGARPGQRAGRGPARVRQGDPLGPAPGRRARAGDGERPPLAGLPGGEPHPAWHRRRWRRHGLVRARAVRPDRRTAVHAARREARTIRQGRRRLEAGAKSAARKPAGASAPSTADRRRSRKPGRRRARPPLDVPTLERRAKPDPGQAATASVAADHPLLGVAARRRAPSPAPGCGSRCEGFDRLPGGPAIYCFNHLSWSDPFA